MIIKTNQKLSFSPQLLPGWGSHSPAPTGHFGGHRLEVAGALRGHETLPGARGVRSGDSAQRPEDLWEFRGIFGDLEGWGI